MEQTNGRTYLYLWLDMFWPLLLMIARIVTHDAFYKRSQKDKAFERSEEKTPSECAVILHILEPNQGSNFWLLLVRINLIMIL